MLQQSLVKHSLAMGDRIKSLQISFQTSGQRREFSFSRQPVLCTGCSNRRCLVADLSSYSLYNYVETCHSSYLTAECLTLCRLSSPLLEEGRRPGYWPVVFQGDWTRGRGWNYVASGRLLWNWLAVWARPREICHVDRLSPTGVHACVPQSGDAGVVEGLHLASSGGRLVNIRAVTNSGVAQLGWIWIAAIRYSYLAK